MSRTGNGSFGPPEGSGRKWGSPTHVPESARCIVKVDWPKAKGDGVRLDLEAIAFAEYIVGADGGRPGGTGRGQVALVKGRENQPVMMFGSHALDGTTKVGKEFARRWLQGDPSLGGQDRSRWTVEQAWCVHMLRRRMAATQFRHSPKEQNLFRIRLCPETSAGVALAEMDKMQDFTRRFMAGVEKDFASETKAKAHFVWVAGAHYNVSHPHVHIGLRGITAEGDHVCFSQQYLRPTEKQLKTDPAASSPIEWRARGVLYQMLNGEVARAG